MLLCPAYICSCCQVHLSCCCYCCTIPSLILGPVLRGKSSSFLGTLQVFSFRSGLLRHSRSKIMDIETTRFLAYLVRDSHHWTIQTTCVSQSNKSSFITHISSISSVSKEPYFIHIEVPVVGSREAEL